MVTKMTKKLLLLSTGGTIASVVSDEGLAPGESGEELIKTTTQNRPGEKYDSG